MPTDRSILRYPLLCVMLQLVLCHSNHSVTSSVDSRSGLRKKLRLILSLGVKGRLDFTASQWRVKLSQHSVLSTLRLNIIICHNGEDTGCGNTHKRTHTHTHTHTYTHAHTRARARVHTHPHASTSAVRTHAHTHTHKYEARSVLKPQNMGRDF